MNYLKNNVLCALCAKLCPHCVKNKLKIQIKTRSSPSYRRERKDKISAPFAQNFALIALRIN